MRECGYLICTAEGSEFYIPRAKHIQADDELGLLGSDEEASKVAESNGVKLIYDFNGVPDGVYIDTQENRLVIKEMLKSYPEYRRWGKNNE